MSPELLKRIRTFRDARDWMQFHNPKDMAVALSIEAAELLEIFLWKKDAEVDAVAAQKRTEIEEELADITIYLLELADNLGVDLERVALAKLEKNEGKYPAELVRGSSKKYSEYNNRASRQ